VGQAEAKNEGLVPTELPGTGNYLCVLFYEDLCLKHLWRVFHTTNRLCQTGDKSPNRNGTQSVFLNNIKFNYTGEARSSGHIFAPNMFLAILHKVYLLAAQSQGLPDRQ
jgi:hypothetical protein